MENHPNPLAPIVASSYRGRSLSRKIVIVRKSLLCRVTRVARNIGLSTGLLFVSSVLDAQAPSAPAGTMVPVPAYRARLLGVYDVDTGQPIEGA